VPLQEQEMGLGQESLLEQRLGLGQGSLLEQGQRQQLHHQQLQLRRRCE